MTIGKYSFGVGDRFAHEGINQLKALELADEFLPALEKHTDVIGEQITANLCDRHIARLFSK